MPLTQAVASLNLPAIKNPCAGMQELARLQEVVKGKLEGCCRQLSALRQEQVQCR